MDKIECTTEMNGNWRRRTIFFFYPKRNNWIPQALTVCKLHYIWFIFVIVSKLDVVIIIIISHRLNMEYCSLSKQLLRFQFHSILLAAFKILLFFPFLFPISSSHRQRILIQRIRLSNTWTDISHNLIMSHTFIHWMSARLSHITFNIQSYLSMNIEHGINQ